MSAAAWDNAILATAPSPFLADLGRAVGNGDNNHAAAVRYWLGVMGAVENPWPTWDANSDNLWRIGRAWSVMHRAADMFGAHESLPRIARFVCDRLPAAITSSVALPHKGEEYQPGWLSNRVTLFVVLAERAHDLVGLFHAGVKVTGSGDQFALRRAAKHWAIAAVMA